MSRVICEPDWKVLRELKPIALDRFCQRVLDEIARVASDASKTSHERYLAVYQLMERRDRELATAFNGLRRSTALLQLMSIQSHGLLTADEMSRFSAETREVVRALTGT
jgi:hypothetical protein